MMRIQSILKTITDSLLLLLQYSKKVDDVYLTCLCELYLFEIDKYDMKFIGQ